MDQIKIGKFIQKLRKEKELTQKDLAEIVGVSDKTISKWENGNGMPDVSNMFVLCQILGINVNELLAGENVSSDEYSKKAEENIMALLETNKETEKSKKLYLAIGIPLIVLGIWLLLISSFGTSFSIWFSFYIDTCYLVVYAMILVACALIMRALRKVEFVKALKGFALPIGGIITLTQLIVGLVNVVDVSCLGPALSVAVLPALYGMITYVVLLFVNKE